MGSDPVNGLEQTEAARRLEQNGPNELLERGVKSPLKILWEQLTASMVVILIAAAVISALLGDNKDAIAILIIVILNALLGLRQEYKAEKSMAALKKLAVPNVKIKRGGRLREISARELVPGDLVLLEEGNLVPADCRLIESINIKIQEAALTGESAPVEKNAHNLLQEETSLADRMNMAYMGTVVTYGRGRGIVAETGMRTELGRIASMIQTVEGELTPLQRRLNQLGKTLALVALGLVAIVAGLGFTRGENLTTLFLTAISLAVAAVPEGLPAVVTIALALGSQRMLRRRALIRKLPAVETLGSVTVICSDKTGTLTENRMQAAILDVAGHRMELPALPERSIQEASAGGKTEEELHDYPPSVALLLAGGSLCSDASVGADPNEPEALGDPTEVAILVAAARKGLWKQRLENLLPRVAEMPFDSERKRMTTVHRFPGEDSIPGWLRLIAMNGARRQPYIAFTKGAVDSLVGRSSGVLHGAEVEPLDERWKERIIAGNNGLADMGMRVLGVAFRQLSSTAAEDLERELVFVGMVGIIDPARPEVKEAVALCKKAGIRPLMITGDHPLTANHIASELGIGSDSGVITGRELAEKSRRALEETAEKISIYARVSPEHKLGIVEALQSRGHIVAMTGDGVNDAPALKKADIGIAMGITGSDVSKEVSDMVLLDDNFATIVSAVEEGRAIYDNIRKFIKYLLTTNSGEIWVMLAAPFLGMPLPLLPLQILWINLVTDGLPALALGFEPPEPDVMRRPPRRPDESVFARGLGRHVLWVGALMGLLPLLLGYWYWRIGNEDWQTMVFTTLAFAQMAHVLAIRSEHQSLFSIGLLSNKHLLAAVTMTIGLQVTVIYVPFLQQFMKTAALSPLELVYCILLSSVIFVAVEIEKWLWRRNRIKTRS